MSNSIEVFYNGLKESFMRSLLCVFIDHIVMMSFNNTTEEANFMLFPMHSKAHLNIFGLM